MTDTKEIEKKFEESKRLISYATVIRKLALSDYIHGYISKKEKDNMLWEADILVAEAFGRIETRPISEVKEVCPW